MGSPLRYMGGVPMNKGGLAEPRQERSPEGDIMTKVLTALSTSLDGFIAGADDSPAQPLGVGGGRLFNWLSDGDTPSRFNPMFKMSAVSAEFFDEGVARVGAAITGRRTYDVSEAWGGSGPMPGIPLFVVTHHVPDTVPAGDPPYTFVTEGVDPLSWRGQLPQGRTCFSKGRAWFSRVYGLD
jgi:dihydrofolate reductase